MIKQYRLPGELDGIPPLRVNGFGACMISGFPYDQTDSFFWKAMAHLQRATQGQPIEGTITSLAAFPAHRAVSHVKRAVASQPEIVVVQLGSTDLTVSVRYSLKKVAPPIPSENFPKSTDLAPEKKKVRETELLSQPYRRTLKAALAGWLKRLVCWGLDVKPLHGDEVVYLKAMRGVISGIASAGAIPVVLAPFPHADPVSDLWALRFSRGLADLCESTGSVFVDSYTGLLDIPRSKLLLGDQLHLSKIGHARVGELLASSLENLALRRLAA